LRVRVGSPRAAFPTGRVRGACCSPPAREIRSVPHHLDLIFTITGGLTAALALGYFTQRVGLSPIVGYLLAGVLVGPFTPGFVADKPLADQLAEIGVILLMFGVGLHFHVRELWAVRKVAIPGALLQIAAATVIGALVGHTAGWSWTAGAVFGVALSVASTVVLTRVLSDGRELHTATGHLAIGWLVLEDLFTVLVLVLLPAFVGPGARGAGDIAIALGLSVLKIGALVAFTFIVGQRAIPLLLGKVARTGSRELFTLTVLVLALGIAVGSALLFGASMALGAFLAGMVVGQSDFSSRAASEALPMRDAFAVLFFVSVGMLLDPRAIVDHWALALATLGVVMVGKPLVAVLVVLGLRKPASTAVAVAIALGQIGEFSFIVAALGKQLGALGRDAEQVLVISAIVSITLNPFLFSRRAVLSRWLARLVPNRKATAEPLPAAERLGPAHRTVVVGHGPVGQTLVRLLVEAGIEPTVVELNVDTVRRLADAGTRAVYGDATQSEILEQAGVREARSLILTSTTGPGDAEAVLRAAKTLQPGIFVLARAAYLREAGTLRQAGADVVVTGEGEVALAMTEYVLARLGATAEQLERERERVRGELVAHI
jgi:CPA2 family monovalent cation:H+ antiporter-2